MPIVNTKRYTDLRKAGASVEEATRLSETKNQPSGKSSGGYLVPPEYLQERTGMTREQFNQAQIKESAGFRSGDVPFGTTLYSGSGEKIDTSKITSKDLEEARQRATLRHQQESAVIKERALKDKVSMDIARTRINSETASGLRKEAREQNLDISTPAKQKSWLSLKWQEWKSGKPKAEFGTKTNYVEADINHWDSIPYLPQANLPDSPSAMLDQSHAEINAHATNFIRESSYSSGTSSNYGVPNFSLPYEKPSGVIEPVKKPSGALNVLEGLRYETTNAYSKLETKGARTKNTFFENAGLVGLGGVNAILDVGIGTKNLITNPKSIFSLPSSTIDTAKSLSVGLQSKNPSYSIGYVGGLVATAKVTGKLSEKPLMKLGEVKNNLFTPNVRVDIVTKPADIAKTPLSKTYGKDIYVFKNNEFTGSEFKSSKPSSLSKDVLSNVKESKAIESAKETLLKDYSQASKETMARKLVQEEYSLFKSSPRYTALKQFKESQSINKAKEGLLKSYDDATKQNIMKDLIKDEYSSYKGSPRSLALKTFKENSKASKPIEFDIKLPAGIRNQMNLFKTNANFLRLNEKGINVLEKTPRLKTKPRGKPLSISETKSPIQFDISLDKDLFAKQSQVGRQQQQILVKPKQITKLIRINMDITKTQPKGIQRMFGGSGLTEMQLMKYRGAYAGSSSLAPLSMQLQMPMQKGLMKQQLISSSQVQAQSQSQSLNSGQLQITSLASLNKLRVGLILTPAQKQNSVQNVMQFQLPRQTQKQFQPQAQNMRQKQIQIYSPALAFRQAQKQDQPNLLFQKQQQKQTTKQMPWAFRLTSHAKRPSGKYNVLVKRFGQWKPLAVGVSLQNAFNIGGKVTQQSLARSFKVTGGSLAGGFIPRGYKTKNTKKQGTYFVEPSKQALNLFSETKELQFWKRKKKKGWF
jgi:hypothetical protein